MDKRVFIVGCPRSGTTLVQSILAAHKNIKSFPETHYFPSLSPAHWIYNLIGFRSNRSYYKLKSFLEDAQYGHFVPSEKEFGLTVKAAISSFVNCLDGISSESGASSWIEKTPRHLKYISTIEKYVKNSKFIHVVRSGKDVVASLYHVTHVYPKQWGGARTLEKCINRWNSDIKITERYKDKNNHYILKYKDVVRRTKKTIRSIIDKLDIGKGGDNIENMIRNKKVSEIKKDSEKWKEKNEKSISQGESKYHDVLTEFQKQDVQNNITSSKLFNEGTNTE